MINKYDKLYYEAKQLIMKGEYDLGIEKLNSLIEEEYLPAYDTLLTLHSSENNLDEVKRLNKLKDNIDNPKFMTEGVDLEKEYNSIKKKEDKGLEQRERKLDKKRSRSEDKIIEDLIKSQQEKKIQKAIIETERKSRFSKKLALLNYSNDFLVVNLAKRPNLLLFIAILIVDSFAFIFGFNNTLITDFIDGNIKLAKEKLILEAKQKGFDTIANIRVIHSSMYYITIQANGFILDKE